MTSDITAAAIDMVPAEWAGYIEEVEQIHDEIVTVVLDTVMGPEDMPTAICVNVKSGMIYPIEA